MLNQAKYSIIKLIPDPVSEESINIGLIMHAPSTGYIQCKYSDEKLELASKLLKSFNKDAIAAAMHDMVEGYNCEKAITRDRPYEEFKQEFLLNKIRSTHSNQILFSDLKGILADNLAEEFDQLFSEIVYSKIEKQRKHRDVATVTSMRSRMKRAFNEAKLIEKNLVTESPVIEGQYNEMIPFDFKYLNGKPNYIANVSIPEKVADAWTTVRKSHSNYVELRKEKQADIGIYLVYSGHRVDSNVIDCLKNSCDDLIEYADAEKYQHYIEKVKTTAHM